MPRIAVRLGGGDFSNLYGSTARGIASGLQSGLDYGERMARMSAAQHALDVEEEARTQAEAERQATQRWYEDQFDELSDDPNEQAAFRGLPPQVQAFEVERRRKVGMLQRQMKSLRRARAFIGAHPRGKLLGQQIDELEQAGAPFDQIARAVQAGEAQLRQVMKDEQGAMELLGTIGQWSQVEGLDPGARNGLLLLGQEIQRQMEAQQDPEYGDVIDEQDIKEWRKTAQRLTLDPETLADIKMEAHQEMADEAAAMMGEEEPQESKYRKRIKGGKPPGKMIGNRAVERALKEGPPPEPAQEEAQPQSDTGAQPKPNGTPEQGQEITRQRLGIKEGQTVSLSQLGGEKTLGPGAVSRRDVVEYLARVYADEGGEALVAKMQELGIKLEQAAWDEIQSKSKANKARPLLTGAVGGGSY